MNPKMNGEMTAPETHIETTGKTICSVAERAVYYSQIHRDKNLSLILYQHSNNKHHNKLNYTEVKIVSAHKQTQH